jgi:hypothetical protein
MSSMLQDALTWFITFLSYSPEPSMWLGLGILLVICSTEREGTADYVTSSLPAKSVPGINMVQEHG